MPDKFPCAQNPFPDAMPVILEHGKSALEAWKSFQNFKLDASYPQHLRVTSANHLHMSTLYSRWSQVAHLATTRRTSSRRLAPFPTIGAGFATMAPQGFATRSTEGGANGQKASNERKQIPLTGTKIREPLTLHVKGVFFVPKLQVLSQHITQPYRIYGSENIKPNKQS